ncbi:putative O-methyltransferase [Xenococcus sp. PCC 7305]|uniref:SAM-dependent methyltransferase n=1 Tax=Xenococcus sp. PCC 7305 TaxID=102125 RepID=UPI0002AC0F4D|nr:methyltransferase domain-containing protein [Xenococcus sp. PCC 7305]ELS02077.1 putative O-methyltransferase [Xenococcus sp. PCC 7305]
MTTTLNFDTAPGHQVLAAAGKTILRPGGKAATEQLFAWANFQPEDTVLELAASFGTSAIALAKRFNVHVVGVEKNPDSVAKARENIQAAGLSDRITIIEGDIFQLDKITDKFDYVLAEAILTMQSDGGKAKILSAIKNHLQPEGKFLAQEMFVRSDESEVRKSLSQSIRVNASPLAIAEWAQACQEAGLNIQQQQTGDMNLLNLGQMLQDEGLWGTVKIAWNVLTHPNLRHRILRMRRSFQQQRHNIGYIAFYAKLSNS